MLTDISYAEIARAVGFEAITVYAPEALAGAWDRAPYFKG